MGPDDLAAELREDDPESLDPVQQALLKPEKIDFDYLYPHLKDADRDTLLAVTKRAISTGQFLPIWFLKTYLEVDGAACVRTLLQGGRVSEAGEACVRVLRAELLRLTPHPPAPRAAPLALADRVLRELAHVRHAGEVYEDLQKLVEEYTQVVKRTSEDMKLSMNYYVAT
ncbi:uncharacterized protein LOC126972507 [Leptidea sinapis]|uniref:uncharacterized protein LOC126972507 n=1 Tax=Leptidea sinapis TaxID=189913 RepID=UPI0021C3376E|nr:uncharacterized protein LOC126972507 [Leptidea sinapis]